MLNRETMTRAAAAMWVGFLLRLLVAGWNTFYGPSLGAEGDASGFHQVAAEYSQSFNTDRFHHGLLYAYALGAVYSVTAASLLLGCVLSCLAWLLSAYTMTLTMRLLSFDERGQFRAMLVYALLPSSILWTGVTMREPYQLLFINVAIYAALKIVLERSRTYWTLLGLSVVGMSLLHGALLVMGLLIAETTLVCVLLQRPTVAYSWKKLFVILPVMAVVAILGSTTFKALYAYPIVEQGMAEAVESYQQGGLGIEARTEYKTEVVIDDTATGFIEFTLITFLQYLFEPLPWNVESLIDVGPLLENLLRAFLIVSACLALFRIRPQQRWPLVMIFIGYIILEGAWSLGTVNWGTAARHHIPSLGMLMVAAFAGSVYEPTRAPSRPLPEDSITHAA
jgi:hypothetical protein